MGKVDRRKYAWDVMEHVLGGIRAVDPDRPPRGRSQTDAESPWSIHIIPSHAELRVVSDEEDEPRLCR